MQLHKPHKPPWRSCRCGRPAPTAAAAAAARPAHPAPLRPRPPRDCPWRRLRYSITTVQDQKAVQHHGSTGSGRRGGSTKTNVGKAGQRRARRATGSSMHQLCPLLKPPSIQGTQNEHAPCEPLHAHSNQVPPPCPNLLHPPSLTTAPTKTPFTGCTSEPENKGHPSRRKPL